MYITHHPCLECIKVIASYGIDEVHYTDLIDESIYDLEAIGSIAKEYNIKLIQGARE
jgi:deoxycytidylate deaminase